METSLNTILSYPTWIIGFKVAPIEIKDIKCIPHFFLNTNTNTFFFSSVAWGDAFETLFDDHLCDFDHPEDNNNLTCCSKHMKTLKLVPTLTFGALKYHFTTLKTSTKNIAYCKAMSSLIFYPAHVYRYLPPWEMDLKNKSTNKPQSIIV